MNALLLFVVLSAVVYRVSRFIALDALIDGTRDRFTGWLTKTGTAAKAGSTKRMLCEKVLTLLGCPWCVTIWVAAATTVAHRLFVGALPMPIWWWLVTATGELVFWAVIEPDE